MSCNCFRLGHDEKFLFVMMRERRDIRVVLLKFGAVLVVSLGGIIYSVLRTNRIKPSESPPSLQPSDCGNRVDLTEEDAALENDDHALEITVSCSNTESVEFEKRDEPIPSNTTTENILSDFNLSSGNSGDNDVLLLPDFRALVKEFDMAATNASNSSIKDVETLTSDVNLTTAHKWAEIDLFEQEIKSLRNMVRVLRERERALEIQLFEYYGLKEQETVIMELQNRLKISKMEAKIFFLKIESLRADNRRLEAQLADYAEVFEELEEARSKIKVLKRKIQFESEQNKEHISSFEKRVRKLQEQEPHGVADNFDINLKLQKLKELEETAEELRKSNESLRMENLNLTQKFESTKVLATSNLEDQEAKALKEESYCLKQQNEDLSKKIEQLQEKRCGDTEEVVYLRWINACLRYELRNYQAGPGNVIARDLNVTHSFRSEEKAKQLLSEYQSKEDLGEKGMNRIDFDFDQCSTSHLTDSADFDGSSVDHSSAYRTNTSIKREDNYHHSCGSSVESTVLSKDCYTDGPCDELGNSSQDLSTHTLDLQRGRSVKVEDTEDLEGVQRASNSGVSGVYRTIVTGRGEIKKSHQENQLREGTGDVLVQRSDLLKNAKVLGDSHCTTSKFHRRSSAASYR